MFLSNDMIRFMGIECILFMYQAIFATSLRALMEVTPQLLRDVCGHELRCPLLQDPVRFYFDKPHHML